MTDPLTRDQARRRVAEVGILPVPLDDLVVDLLATVEAQAEVIERYKEGWVPVEGGWGLDDADYPTPEPMSERAQLVLYGEVVRGDSDE